MWTARDGGGDENGSLASQLKDMRVKYTKAISRSRKVEIALKKQTSNKSTCLIIRTLPNPIEKQFYCYSKEIPPFFTNDAMIFLLENNIKHLVIDIPSLDRIEDEGILGNHRIFWSHTNDPRSKVNPNSISTITELAYIPNHVKDGFYFLNLQLPHFQCDAAPSRPIIMRPI